MKLYIAGLFVLLLLMPGMVYAQSEDTEDDDKIPDFLLAGSNPAPAPDILVSGTISSRATGIEDILFMRDNLYVINSNDAIYLVSATDRAITLLDTVNSRQDAIKLNNHTIAVTNTNTLYLYQITSTGFTLRDSEVFGNGNNIISITQYADTKILIEANHYNAYTTFTNTTLATHTRLTGSISGQSILFIDTDKFLTFQIGGNKTKAYQITSSGITQLVSGVPPRNAPANFAVVKTLIHNNTPWILYQERGTTAYVVSSTVGLRLDPYAIDYATKDNVFQQRIQSGNWDYTFKGEGAMIYGITDTSFFTWKEDGTPTPISLESSVKNKPGLAVNDHANTRYLVAYPTGSNTIKTTLLKIGDDTAPTITVPNAPIPKSSATHLSINVSWAEPNTGGAAITQYIITANGNVVKRVDGDTLSAVYITPSAGSYRIGVAAVNTAGTSEYGYTTITTTAAPTVPGTPAPTASASNLSINVSWAEPDTGGTAITQYIITVNGTELKRVNADTLNTSYTAPSAGAYKIGVAAVNSVGTSSYGYVTITATAAPTVPGTPAPTANATHLDINISWPKPATGGAEITQYVITVNGTELKRVNADTLNTSYTAPSAGAYKIGVAAVNSVGTSSYGYVTITATAAPTVPGTPAPTANATHLDINISWPKPATGGAEITQYVITVNGTELKRVNADTLNTSYTAPSAGAYKIGVAAVNSVGTSSYGYVTITATAAPTVPGTPAPTANATHLDINISWPKPATGGAEITQYVITVNGTELKRVNADTLNTSYTAPSAGAYKIGVAAVNSVGTSSYGYVTITATAAPTIPETPLPSVKVSGLTLTISWSAPNDGGTSITHYSIRVNNEIVKTVNVPNLSTTYTVSGTGTYRIGVAAVNATGTSQFGYTNITITDSIPQTPLSPNTQTYTQPITTYNNKIPEKLTTGIFSGAGTTVISVTHMYDSFFVVTTDRELIPITVTKSIATAGTAFDEKPVNNRDRIIRIIDTVKLSDTRIAYYDSYIGTNMTLVLLEASPTGFREVDRLSLGNIGKIKVDMERIDSERLVISENGDLYIISYANDNLQVLQSETGKGGNFITHIQGNQFLTGDPLRIFAVRNDSTVTVLDDATVPRTSSSSNAIIGTIKINTDGKAYIIYYSNSGSSSQPIIAREISANIGGQITLSDAKQILTAHITGFSMSDNGRPGFVYQKLIDSKWARWYSLTDNNLNTRATEKLEDGVDNQKRALTSSIEYTVIAYKTPTGFKVVIFGSPDNEAPTLTIPNNISVETDNSDGIALNIGKARATDKEDANPVITNNAPSTFPIGTTQVIWTARDNVGNITTKTQIVTVNLTPLPDPITLTEITENYEVSYTRTFTRSGTDTMHLSLTPLDGKPRNAKCVIMDQDKDTQDLSYTPDVQGIINQSWQGSGTHYIKCTDDTNVEPELIFWHTSFKPWSNTSGFMLLNEIFGDNGLFGVPWVMLFVLAFAAIWTGKSAQVGVIATAAVIGVLVGMGLFELPPAAWAVIILLVASGMIMGKKLL